MLIPALLTIPPLMVLAVAALYPTNQLFPNQGDLNLYLQKAQAFAAGGLPYRDFSFEYPPAALVPMVVPYLLGFSGTVDLDRYKWLFAGWNALLLLGLVLMRIVRLGGDALSAALDQGASPARDRSSGIAQRQGGVALHLVL